MVERGPGRCQEPCQLRRPTRKISFQTNSGVFARFRNPESTGYYNPAWSAVFIPGTPATPSGFEVQIDNTGVPDGRLKHKTGAVYAVNYPSDLVDDTSVPAPTPGDFVNPQNLQVLAWNQYRIDVQGDVISVNLNGVDTAKYTNTDPNRAAASRRANRRLSGLQSYSNYSFPDGLSERSRDCTLAVWL